ncbi:hypothetical protein [Acetobacter sp. UBA5411]|uniref:hypothetical protein n=1 Tax=Acetobacter sp. UBA5411 TaxID=1945905 RepID=UPI0025B7AA8B|nr:hypothetical protein [Acetobacter sp. UBA5411]
MSSIPQSSQSKRIAKIIFDALSREIEMSGLSISAFMRSIGVHVATYNSLKEGWVPSGMTMLRLFYQLDIDQKQIGKMIDLAEEFNETRVEAVLGVRPVRATPKTARPASAGHTQAGL